MEFMPRPNLNTKKPNAMKNANETAPNANVITLSEGQRKKIEDKLAEYKKVINNSDNFRPSQGVLYGFALAEALLNTETVNIAELKKQLMTIYGSEFEPEVFKAFCEEFAGMAVGLTMEEEFESKKKLPN